MLLLMQRAVKVHGTISNPASAHFVPTLDCENTYGLLAEQNIVFILSISGTRVYKSVIAALRL